MTAIDHQWLEEVVLSGDAVRRVVKLSSVTSEPAVAAGENFASIISRAKAAAVLGNGKEVPISLIVKKIPEKESQVGFVQSHSFFETEILLYRDILPMMEEVLREQGVPPLWPIYFGQRGSYLIFSDLKSKNYDILCRKDRLDLEHALLAVRTLGFFHGASVVLDRRGQLEAVKGLDTAFLMRDTPEIRKLQEGGFRTAAKVILEQWGPEWTDIGERLLAKSNTISQELNDLSKLDKSRLNLLCHGDLWTPNLMFKYSKGVDRPIGVRYIDFQLSHYNSYAMDLIYFISTAISPELRRNALEKIITEYRRGLNSCLEFHGLSDMVPSLEEIKDELRRLDLYTLGNLICITPIQVTTIENALDFDKLISDKEDVIAQHPEIYEGNFKYEVEIELRRWAEEGLF